MRRLRFTLGFLTAMTLALTPAVSPVGPFVVDAGAVVASSDQYLVLADGSDAGSGSGVNDGLTANGVIPSTGDFSIEAWIYPDSLNNSSVWHQIVQQSGNSASNYGRFGLNLKTAENNSTAGYAGVQVIYDGLNLDATTNPAARVWEDRWTHVAVTVDWDASNTVISLYLNGTLAVQQAGNPNNDSIRTDGFTVGYFPENFDTTDRHFHGGIDQVKVWGGLLDATQLQQSMNSFSTTGVSAPPTLRAHLSFNDDYSDEQENYTFTQVGTISRSALVEESVVGNSYVLEFPRSYLVSGGGWTIPSGVSAVDYLVVAGGGGGGGGQASMHGGGGGGAGGALWGSTTVSSTVSVTVGAGGSGGAITGGFDDSRFAAAGTNGGNSVFGSITAVGGGGGGAYGEAPKVGGSGGGAGNLSGNNQAGAAGTLLQGYSGGAVSGLSGGYGLVAAGGGGRAAVGGSAVTNADGTGTAGSGGPGITNTLDGTSRQYAGGGGGGGLSTGGLGSYGGGNGGNQTSGAGANATANTGGGGGGGHGTGGSNAGVGGNGGSGIVVLRYSRVPEAPTSVSASSGNGQATITYSAPSHTGGSAIADYEYSLDAGSSWTSLGETDGSTVITGLSNRTSYSIQVRAVNADGYSGSASSAASVIPSPVGEILRLDATHPDSYSGSGTTWADLAGSLDGTLTSGPSYSTREKAFQFDGTDDYVDLPDMAYDFSNGLAIHAVVDFGDAQSWERILDFGNGENDDNIVFGRYDGTTQLVLQVSVDDVGQQTCYSDSGAIAAGMHSYSAIIDSNGTCSFYRDAGDDLVADGYNSIQLPGSVIRESNYVGKANWSNTNPSQINLQSLVVYNTAQTTPLCQPVESTFTGNGTIGDEDVPYTVAEFTTAGPCLWTVPSGIVEADYLVVAGGGGGGGHIAGGGGAGEVVSGTKSSLSPGTQYTMTVGLGGVGGVRNYYHDATYQGQSGADSSAFMVSGTGGITANGGGGGGNILNSGKSGGSGGGAGAGVTGYAALAGGTSVLDGSGYGHAGGAGGNGSGASAVASGGGGAGAAGGASNVSTQSGGAGGAGRAFTITGASVTYAGGGGGGINTGAGSVSTGEPGAGSTGGGGAGGAKTASTANADSAGQAGVANLGAGGGGASGNGGTSTLISGGHGGSGTVIVRYSLYERVEFEPNGGSGAATSQLVNSGSATALSANTFTKAGYTFAGWDTIAGGGGTDYSDQQLVTITDALTLYAQWTPASLTVSWNSNGGSSVSDSSVNTGGSLSAPTPPTRAGYYFDGWSATDGGSVVSFPYAHPNTSDFSMYAVWEGGPLLAYEPFSGSAGADVNGNSGSGASGFSGTWSTVNAVKQGSDAALSGQYVSLADLGLPSNTGFSRPSANIGIGGPSLSTWKLRYTARELERPISFDSAGTYYYSYALHKPGSGSAMVGFLSGLPEDSSDDTEWSLFAGSGYSSKYAIDYGDANVATWVTGQSRQVASGYNYSAVSAGSTALTTEATAQFMLVKISTVASGSDEVKLKVFSASDTLPVDDSTIAWDVSFSGAISGTANYVAVETEYSPVVDEFRMGLTYDSVTDPYLSVAWDSQGGSSVSNSLVKSGGTLAAPADPTRSGYLFSGWSATDGGSAVTFPYAHPNTSNFTMYALWTSSNYTVSFQAGDHGSGSNRADTKVHGTALTLPNTPTANSYFTRTGYAVVGWSTNSDGSTTDFALGGSYTTNSGTTLYPVWEPNFCFVPSDDTFVNAGTGGATAYGASGEIVLKNAVDDPNSRYNRLGYLKFEYDPSTTWSGATLELTVSGSSDGGNRSWYNGVNDFEVKVYGVSDADWSESTLTFNTANAETSEGWGINTSPWPWAPDSGTLLGTIDVPTSTSTIGNTYGLSSAQLDSFLNADSDGDVTFFLVRTDTQGQPNLSFATKENSTLDAPTLRQYSTSCAYPITYRANGGSGTLPDSGVYIDGGSSYSVAAATNVTPPSGKIFDEWNTRADGSGTSYSPSDSYSATNSLTLFAQYLNQYTVSFNKGSAVGAAGSDQTSVKSEGTVLTLPNAAMANTYFTRTGYTVTGWATSADGSGTTFALGGSYTTEASDTLYPVWTPNTYTVTFSKGSASGAAGSDQTDTKSHFVDLALPDSATANTYFTRTGYTVTGWATNADGSGSTFALGGSYTTEAAGTLYPIWTLNTYTITYAKGSVSGATGSNQTATKNHFATLTLPNSATANSYFSKTGYTVAAWSTSADGSTSDFAFGASYTTEGDETLYPVWTPNTYTVNYEYNGATGGNSALTSSYTVDSIVVSLPNPTKTGYTFGGWYSDDNTFSSSVGAAGESYTPSGDITIYAKWTATTFTVVYEYNGATAGNSTTDDDYTTGGTAITLPTPTRDGYTFSGWYSNVGLTASVAAGAPTYSPTTNLTIYAKWTAVNRSVTYASTNKTGGLVPTDSDTYIIGDTVVIRGNTGLLVRTGYTFAGWTVAEDGSGTLLNAGSTLTVSTSNITLYPKWSPATFTITYHPNGGAGTLSQTSDSYTTLGTSVTLPSTVSVTKTGYTFAGWALTPSGSAVSSPFTTTSDVTLYARWTIKDISYTFGKGVDGAGSSLSAYGFSAFPADDMDPYGTSVTLPSTDQEIDVNGDSVTDHQFGGWSDGASIFDGGDPYILGDADVSFVAQWVRVYSVRYVLAGGSLYGTDQLTDSECVGSNDTCTDGQTITLNRTPTRAGYTFLGWEDQSGQLEDARASTAISSSSYIFTAKWDAIDYSVSFDSAGGSISIPLSSTNNIGDLITLQSPGINPGYSLSGWEDSSGVLYAVGTTYRMGASSESFEAQWIPNIYSVTYDWQGGVSSTPKVSDNYTVGTGDMSLATASGNGYTRDGYTFSGWSQAVGGSVETAFQPSANDVLYAVWADGNYTLSYNPSGGSVGSGIGTVPRTSSITLPTPVRDSFTFVGWYDAASGGTKLGDGGASYTPSSSETLYARWVQDSLYGVDLATLETANTYTASSATATDTTISHGPSSSSARVQIPAGALPNGTVVTVRYFKDTNRQADLISGENTYFFSLLVSWLYGSGNSATVPDTASGKPITVTLTNSNIKAGAMVYQVIGETVTELGRATVDGSVTVELTEDPEVVVAATKPSAPTSVSGTSADSAASVSWTAATSGGAPVTKYTVTASPGGGTCETASTTCSISGLTNNTAYTFSVTATNAIGTSASSSASSAVTPRGTTYTVTFNSNGGSSVTAGSFFSGGSVSSPSSPSRSGYTFQGWSTTQDDDSTEVSFPYSPGVLNAITLYALWDVAPASSRSSSRATVVTPVTPTTPVLPNLRVLPRPTVLIPAPLKAPVIIPSAPPVAGNETSVAVGGRSVTSETVQEGDAVKVKTGRIEVGLSVPKPSPTTTVRPNPATASPEVVVGVADVARLDAKGLLPGSSVQVWLPGAEGRELVRSVVSADGSIAADIPLTATRDQAPVPIGPQVLQVTGVDEAGNQTVIDMTINVVQGAPAPELNRVENSLPDMQPGQSLATSAGQPETVTVVGSAETREVSVTSAEWSFTVSVPETHGSVEAETQSSPTIRVVQEKTAEVSGVGFQPDTRVDIFLFSDPTLLGSFTVNADGSFTAEVFMDQRFAVVGVHTLQIQGVGTDGYVKAANLGVLVDEPLAVTTAGDALGMLWWAIAAFIAILLFVVVIVALRRSRRLA